MPYENLGEPEKKSSKFVHMRIVAAPSATKQGHTNIGEPGSLPRPLWQVKVVSS